MQYFILFLEGIITFISPCMLPMLPIYAVYFAGNEKQNKTGKELLNSIGFVLGFTTVFVILGAFAGIVGGFLIEYKTILNIISGTIVILFGLNLLEVIKLPAFSQGQRMEAKVDKMKFFSAFLFGVVFSISWTPCVGTFLGSALMIAGQQGKSLQGIVMLLFYSLGLGIPFVISAVLIDRLKAFFDAIKRYYKIINVISSIFLIIIGILIMTGRLGYFLSLLT